MIRITQHALRQVARGLRRWQWAAISILIVTVVIALAMILRPDKTWTRVRTSGVVRFGIDAGYMPFGGVTASGEFVGLEPDLARELAGRLGLRAEFVFVGADRLYETLMAGQCDVLISALTPDPARTKDFRYTAPYFDAGLVLVAPARSAPNLKNLTGRTLAVETGSDADMRARWQARRTVGLRVIERDTPGEAIQAVESGLADAALTDTVAARQAVRASARGTLSIGPRQTSAPYVLAVRADAPALLRALDSALSQVKADGALERLITRWLDQ